MEYQELYLVYFWLENTSHVITLVLDMFCHLCTQRRLSRTPAVQLVLYNLMWSFETEDIVRLSKVLGVYVHEARTRILFEPEFTRLQMECIRFFNALTRLKLMPAAAPAREVQLVLVELKCHAESMFQLYSFVSHGLYREWDPSLGERPE